jgi:regulator of protease activity HflC (stomatin/prohibitin superfamily)
VTKLFDLALAAEARGRAQDLLDRARAQTDRLRLELEAEARDLVELAQRDLIAASRPGEQIPLATREASYASRTVRNDRRIAW